MKPADLAQEIDIEFEAMQRTVDELQLLVEEFAHREPSIRDLAAAGLFLANFYNGIENALKRLCRYHRVEIPSGGDSHIELTKAFCDPPRDGLCCWTHNWQLSWRPIASSGMLSITVTAFASHGTI
jgi:hypothetical protein